MEHSVSFPDGVGENEAGLRARQEPKFCRGRGPGGVRGSSGGRQYLYRRSGPLECMAL